MHSVTFTAEEYKLLLDRFDSLEKKLTAKEKKPSEIWLDNRSSCNS